MLAGRDLAVVREEVKAALRTFLSALSGGGSGEEWPLSTDLERLEVWAAAARVEGSPRSPGSCCRARTASTPTGCPLTGLQLPRLVAVSVRQGQPQPLEELLGTALDRPEVPLPPIPFVPAEC